MITEQQIEFNRIFGELAKSLDITEEQHKAAVVSYEFVGQWLADPTSPLHPYEPQIVPQGSFMLGTMIKTVHEDDELDIDLVCQLNGKSVNWSQFDLKQKIGDRIKDHGTLKRLLDEEGRRCWTLSYAESAKFHLDILPAIVSENFKILLEKSMSARDISSAVELAIRITDKETSNYYRETNPKLWLKSNPFGYGAWFKECATLEFNKGIVLRETVRPVPVYEKNKLPLQVVVQILKRHRDLMFNGNDDKPISIIITTLAARAYQKQTSITNALIDVVNRMPSFIEERYDPASMKYIKWISNPINPEENFADKWPSNPNKQANFYKWLHAIKADIENAIEQRGLYRIQESLSKSFGSTTVSKAFESMAVNSRVLRENGQQKMAASTGILGSSGIKVANHTFDGSKE